MAGSGSGRPRHKSDSLPPPLQHDANTGTSITTTAAGGGGGGLNDDEEEGGGGGMMMMQGSNGYDQQQQQHMRLASNRQQATELTATSGHASDSQVWRGGTF